MKISSRDLTPKEFHFFCCCCESTKRTIFILLFLSYHNYWVKRSTNYFHIFKGLQFYSKRDWIINSVSGMEKGPYSGRQISVSGRTRSNSLTSIPIQIWWSYLSNWFVSFVMVRRKAIASVRYRTSFENLSSLISFDPPNL